MEIVLASHNQLLYRATISGPEGIADLVGDRHCDALTTAGGFQFWFAATSRGAGRLNGRTHARGRLPVGRYRQPLREHGALEDDDALTARLRCGYAVGEEA